LFSSGTYSFYDEVAFALQVCFTAILCSFDCLAGKREEKNVECMEEAS